MKVGMEGEAGNWKKPSPLPPKALCTCIVFSSRNEMINKFHHTIQVLYVVPNAGLSGHRLPKMDRPAVGQR
jgi:hypothetical protein